MDIPQRTMNAVGKRDESIRRWMTSSTAKATTKTDDTHFKITFENGSMLLSAVSSGDIEEVDRLLQLGTDVNYSSADGLTALHQACIDESIELVEVLIKAGANINARDNEGWTPLHAAASTTSLEVVSYLVKNGANLSAVNTDGELAVDLSDEDDIKDFLMESITANKINLTSARNLEHDKMLSDIDTWISKGQVEEIRDPQGASSLHVAASKSYMDIMELLVNRLKMDINIRDNDGWTPLHASVYWKQLDAVSFLLDHGADYQAKTAIGLLPMDLADEDIILKYKAMIRKQNVSLSYTKKSTSDDSNDGSATSPEVFPHSYKPLPNPILKILAEPTKLAIAKPLPPARQQISPSKPRVASSMLPPRPTATASSSMLPPRPATTTASSSILPPRPATTTASSSILPPRPATTAGAGSSSILPPRPTTTAGAGSSSILPPRPATTAASSILPPKLNTSGVSLPPSKLGAARPTSTTKLQNNSEIPRPTTNVGTTYTFKTLEEAMNEVVKLNKMVESYKKEISLLESQLDTPNKSTGSNSTATAVDIQNVMDENKRLQKENTTLIKAMSTLQKMKSKP